MPGLESEKPLTVVSLNIWGGRIYQPLMDFLQRYKDTDVFCFQEVFNGGNLRRPAVCDSVNDIFTRLSETLPDHRGYYCAEQTEEEGEAIFTQRSLCIEAIGSEFVHRWKDAMAPNEDGRMLGRALQWVQLTGGSKRFTVAQLHGLWDEQGKADTPARLAQSRKTRAILDSLPGKKVLVGDFNLLPDTESIKILGQGMRNLIKDYGVAGTRTPLYTKPERYTDYALVSPDVTVHDFRVLPDVVSDHAPLRLAVA